MRRWRYCLALLLTSASMAQPPAPTNTTTIATSDATSASTDHVAASAPQSVMAPMTSADMSRVMQMDDSAAQFQVTLDELERALSANGDTSAWYGEAWYGGDFDKLWLRSEGEASAVANSARVEIAWDHAFASFWDWQLGLRRDFGDTPGLAMPARDWLGFGVRGVAPYWIQMEATAYLGADGRSAVRLRVEDEVRLSQRLILTPELELNVYGRGDRARDMAAGLSDAEIGVRLRYEIRREIAPYLGVVRRYRADADVTGVPSSVLERSATEVVAGVRLWF